VLFLRESAVLHALRSTLCTLQPAQGFGMMPDTRANGVGGGNGDGVPVSSDANVPPGDRLRAGNLQGQV